MNRIVIGAFVLCLAAAAITIAILLVRGQDFPADARGKVDRYIRYRYSPSRAVTIQQIARSSVPSHFTPAMSRATFGDSTFFRTTYGYSAQAGIDLPGFPTVTPGTSGSPSGGGSRPVPFPPMDVWCVLLKDTGQSSPAIVFVALHQDLYSADWLVHEPQGDAKEIADALSKIGCDLKPGE